MGSPPWPSIDAHLASGRILWFGEMHGTEESPRFVGDVAIHASHSYRVQLALEIPRDVQRPIDEYLCSDGGADPRATLLEGAFWGWEDGRSSDAMLALLERIRSLRATGTIIDIIAFDIASGDGSDAQIRDAAMADCLIRARDRDAVCVVLSGSIHSRRIAGAPWDPGFVPAAAHLVARDLPITTFDVAANGGTFWGIVGDIQSPRCGVHTNFMDGPGDPWTLASPRDEAHDWIYRVGTTVASHPARHDSSATLRRLSAKPPQPC